MFSSIFAIKEAICSISSGVIYPGTNKVDAIKKGIVSRSEINFATLLKLSLTFFHV